MNSETNFQKFTDLERRALTLLSEDSRISVSELASELGVSKATASRLVKSLRAKGVRFTVEVPGGYPIAFVVTRRPHQGECHRLVDGRFMVVVKAWDFNELVEAISGIRDREAVYITLGPGCSNELVIPRLICDYCSGPINGQPIIYRRGRRTYYLCCRTCLRELKKRIKQLKTIKDGDEAHKAGSK